MELRDPASSSPCQACGVAPNLLVVTQRQPGLEVMELVVLDSRRATHWS
jgi:hypothetical protein